MPEDTPNPREQAYTFSLAQVGLEMAAPIGLGWLLDHTFGWAPWGVVGGAVFGLVGGLLHLMHMVKRHDDEQSRKPPGSSA